MARESVRELGFDYSIRIAELVRYLREDDKGFSLCGPLLTCGLEAGLACRDPAGRQYPHAAEQLERADYILEMALTAGYLTPVQSGRIRQEGRRLLALLRDTAQPDGSGDCAPQETREPPQAERGGKRK